MVALNWFNKKKESEKKPAPETHGVVPSEAVSSSTFFQRLKKGLSKTRQVLTTDIDELFSVRKRIDASDLEHLEELLITADIGVHTATTLIEKISREADRLTDADALKTFIKTELLQVLNAGQTPPPAPAEKPHVILVVGVNGVGKTTTIGKIAAKRKAKGESVLIAAADTFRAAAIEQLEIWARRAGAEIIKHKENSDPAAVAFDAMEAAFARGSDTVIIDTAGRLHTKVNLMEELKKIRRTVARRHPGSPHETLLVLDATTGQNAVSQARLFHEALEISGIALTKLDGTAKGGIVVGICSQLQIPLKYIGVGESIEDLQDFDPALFVDALF
ncbi:MAG: signal recognition particle-docking protein FtsY [Deltaproteobacteria bacterium]|nr:signal recognition particle-docking protein FtsY [Deltaproteobacteria bacterium]